MADDTVPRPLAWSGVAGSLVGFAAVLLAALLSPRFSWTADAVSQLGAPGAAVPWVLNGGLVASGLVSLPFARAVWRDGAHPVQRLGAAAFALAMASLALVGLFPVGTDAHAPAAIAYFGLATVTLWVHGTGTVLAGAPRRGLAAIWLGIVHVLSWVAWAAGLRPGPGLAVPEMVGSVLFFAWVLLATLALDATRVDPPLDG